MAFTISSGSLGFPLAGSEQGRIGTISSRHPLLSVDLEFGHPRSDGTEAAWPSARIYHAMAYHSAMDRIVMFGGLTTSGATNDTWILDPTNRTWELLPTARSPPARAAHALVYDPLSQLIVLFGGANYAQWPDGQSFGDTWAFDLATREWSQLHPPSSPSARSRHGMAYEPGSGRIVLFGGTRNNETWTYETGGNVWTRIYPKASPPASVSAVQMAYNAATGKIVLVQWVDSSTEVWRYDPALLTWSRAAGKPPFYARFDGSLVDESVGGRLLLFGGDAGYHGDSFTAAPLLYHYDETWRYDVGFDAWDELQPTGNVGDRAGHAAVYYPRSGEIVVFGGSLGYCPYLNDEMWFYEPAENLWVPTPHGILPSPPFGLHASGIDQTNTLTWKPPRETGATQIINYRIYWAPREPDPPPSVFDWAKIDTSNVTALAHWGVLNGMEYIYFVSAVNGWGEGPRSCAAVTVPRARPGAPQNLTAQAGDREILLRWEPPANASHFFGLGYDVYRGVSPDYLTFLVTTVNLTYVDTSLTNGVTYYYHVVAFSRPFAAADESPPSVVVSATPAFQPLQILLLGATVTATVATVALFLQRRRKGPPRGARKER